MRQHRRARLLVFTLGVLLVSTGASWPLNPLVTRNPNAPAASPVECEQGLAPAPAPRVNVAELPTRAEIMPAAVPAAPPSRTLRRTLEDAHAALVRNDRPAFDTALANARLILRDYPPGAERTHAEEALRAYDDAAFLWDAQFRSPFFDQSSEAYARASRYPGYTEAVRRGVFMDDADRRFYPAAESRTFLSRVAADRLDRLGIRTTTPAPAPTRIARAERSTPAFVPAPSTPRRTTPRRASSTSPGSRTTRTRKSATPAITAPASPDPPAPARAVAESAPAAPPAAAPTPAADPASPAAEGQPVDDAPEPVTTEPAPETPDTALTSTAPSLPPPPGAPPPASGRESRSVLVPALLIFIGLGVLFVLFRVSK